MSEKVRQQEFEAANHTASQIKVMDTSAQLTLSFSVVQSLTPRDYLTLGGWVFPPKLTSEAHPEATLPGDSRAH